MKSKFGLWRVRTAIGVTFTIPMRNEGVIPFEIPEGSLEFITYLDEVVGEQQEAILAKMMSNYWSRQECLDFIEKDDKNE